MNTRRRVIFPLMFAGLTVAMLTQLAIEHAEERTGPDYPTMLPAGYCLLTNGKEYVYSRTIKYGRGLVRVKSSGEESAQEAIRWAWRMREYKPKATAEIEAEEVFRPVNPELCKTDK